MYLFLRYCPRNCMDMQSQIMGNVWIGDRVTDILTRTITNNNIVR